MTREHLSPQDAEDLFQLHITAAQDREHTKFLDTDTLQAILHSQSYPPWYLEIMLSHDRLGHLSFVDMFKLVECGRKPKKFIEMKGKTLVCPSFVFCKGKA